MKNRIVLITGANSGIGKAAAFKFASEGYHVIMAGRNAEKSTTVQQEIIRNSNNNSVDFMEVDLSSFESIRNFCLLFKSKHQKLDILIHNAGYFNHGAKVYQFSTDVIELTFATNTFGPFLMTQLLLENLAKSDDPRVLSASSTNIKHFFDPKRKIEFDNLQGEYKTNRPYSAYKMYGDSKMGLLLLIYKMAEEYKKYGIKVNSLMIPATKISKETLNKMSRFYRIIGQMVQNLNPHALLPEQIASNYYHICTSDEFRNTTGTLINASNEIILPSQVDQPLNLFATMKELWDTKYTPPYANNRENIEKMWTLSKELTARAYSCTACKTT